MSEAPIESPTTEEIMKQILASAEVHSAATKHFANSFIFYGKSLEEWGKRLTVRVTTNPTPEKFRELHASLANNIQIANHFYSISSSINSTLIGGGALKKADLVTAIVRSYEVTVNRKRPAGTIIEQMADSYMQNTVSSSIASTIVKQFWKGQLDTLREVRKNLEQIGISIHSEMKYLHGDGNEEKEPEIDWNPEE